MGKSGKRKGYRPRSQREQAKDAARVAAAQAAEKQKATYQRAFLLVCALLLLVGLAFGVASLARGCAGEVALSTPHCRIDADMLTYYFYDYYMAELADARADYIEKGLDPTKPLGEQMYDAKTSWEGYFLSAVKASLRRMLVFAEAAHREGVAPSYTAECQAAAEATVASLRRAATDAGVTLEAYLAACYGERVSEETVRRAAELSALAEARYRVLAEKTYTEEERMALYAQDPGAYQTGDVIAYSVKVNLPQGGGEDEVRAAYLAAESRANAIAAARDEQAFRAALTADLQEAYPSYTARKISARVDDAYIYHIPAAATGLVEDWLHTDGRADGDTAVLGETGNYTVVFCLAAPREVTYHRASAQYILLPYANYHTEVQAEEAAEALLSEFLSGAQTAEAFATLAAEHGSTGSSVFSSVTYGDLEKPLCDWLMAEGRTVGEVAVLAGQEGYYLLRYAETSPLPFWQELVANALQEAEYRTLLEASGVTVYENACTVPAIVPAN